MSAGVINLAQVRPWWLRVLLLAIVASPLFGFSGLPHTLHAERLYADLAAWCGYAVFVWLLVGMTAGVERLVGWLAVGAIFGLTVAMSGAVLRRLDVWALIERLAHLVTQGTTSATVGQTDLVFRLILVMIAVPYALLALNSFPAMDFLRRAVAPDRTRGRDIWLGVAIFLRMFQHVFEIAERMMLAWREENPRVIVPRYRTDWRGGLLKPAGFIGWFRVSVWVWSIGLLEQALLFVPVAVRDWQGVIRD